MTLTPESMVPGDGIELREGDAEVGDVKLHYVEAGDGPLVVLLHGFPEFWFGWRQQIKPLAAAGYRVVAPDMRGYNLSSRPDGVAAYDTGPLTADIRGLVEERGAKSAMLVGHDWGGSVAWATAMIHPEIVERLAHPSYTPEEIDRYVEAWSQPGAAAGMINYYRASVRAKNAEAQIRSISAPTLVIWGEQDRYLGPELAEPDHGDVPNLDRVERLPDASHWVHHDSAELVTKLLIDFFSPHNR